MRGMIQVMKKYIAVVLAVLVVMGALLFKVTKPEGFRDIVSNFSKPLSLSLPDLSLNLPGFISNQPKEAQEAWQIFVEYRKAAKNHDLPKLKSLSYRISATCANSASEKDCFDLMNNVYNITKDWQEEYFSQSYFDARQVVLIANSNKMPFGAALIFVQAEGGLKLLGIKWCLPDPDTGKVSDCVNTDPNTRDANKNGWWDDVEALFNK